MINNSTIIDFHGHSGRWDLTGMIREGKDMVRVMDAVGIDYSCVFNIFHDNCITANDITASLVQRTQGRLIGFAYAAPLATRLIIAELERACDRLGMRAIKIYPPAAHIATDDRRWDDVYSFANERSLTIITHTDMRPDVCQPYYIMSPAERFPETKFVCGHAGNIPEARRQAIEAARRCPNVYLETCSTFRSTGVIEELVENVGSQKVLFGSDAPLMDPRCQIGKILTARISPKEAEQILGLNAVKLLGLRLPY